MNRQHFESLLERRREQERQRQSIQQRLHEAKISAGYAHSEDRVNKIIQQNRYNAYKEAIHEEENYRRQEEERKRRIILQEQEERIARELEKRKKDKLLEEKTLQKLREESDELRSLEQKLSLAYVNIERDYQLQEKKRNIELEKVYSYKVLEFKILIIIL